MEKSFALAITNAGSGADEVLACLLVERLYVQLSLNDFVGTVLFTLQLLFVICAVESATALLSSFPHTILSHRHTSACKGTCQASSATTTKKKVGHNDWTAATAHGTACGR